MRGECGWSREIRIGEAVIGPGRPVYVVAEAGVNHNGDLSLAMAMVEAAAAAGADAVKFQAFSAERLTTEAAATAEYQPGENQREMLSHLELHPEDFAAIAALCGGLGIELLLTPFGVEELAMAVELGCRAVKVASPDVTNLPLLEAVGRTGLPVILSTGGADLDEIAAARRTLAGAGTKELALLQCVSGYPTPLYKANLRCIATLAEAFGAPVGYSDHTMTMATGELAVKAGACILEKHFTLDPSLPGPDQALSFRPVELTAYIARARAAVGSELGDEASLDPYEKQALGDGVKRARAIERDVMRVARSSVTTATAVAAGATITAEMLTIKRPGGGIAPAEMGAVVGRVAAVDIPADTTVTADMLR